MIANLVLGSLAGWLVYWQVRPVFGVRFWRPEQLAQALAEGRSLQLVDVRTPGEFAAGHLPGSVSIPLAQLRRRTGEIDRERPVVLICRSGHRAMQAYHILRRRHYAQLVVLRGGVLHWQAYRRMRAGPGAAQGWQ
ncbi:protein of unknown function [Candidatus Hydrogenisulfobacillus filiaventi]|uniref:Rhodanese domain-containing protein n=1 Tax=Candidatus Hydrogenisulfobacillus filiaventi TaxID=2707344 RepID=A0A6F8ZGX1_9FIRM|nr:rhodanese-like domain-containing protein [Bacillota bacterium]CAB1128705.1 protein of unknown function [Candidatus Hydrogenisulfobacillus filiaventi]